MITDTEILEALLSTKTKNEIGEEIVKVVRDLAPRIIEVTKKDKLLIELLKLQSNRDRESAHCQADDLIIAYIDDADIKKAYDDVPKWYA